MKALSFIALFVLSLISNFTFSQDLDQKLIKNRVQQLIKNYELSLNKIGSLPETEKTEIMAKKGFADLLSSTNIFVLNDLDTTLSKPEQIEIRYYLDKLEEMYPLGLEVSLRHPAIDIAPAYLNKSRHTYMTEATIDKKTSFPVIKKSVIDSVRIDSLVQDSIVIYDTTVTQMEIVDTVSVDKFHKLHFYISFIKEGKVYDEFKIAAISYPKLKPQYPDLPKIVEWWVNLSPAWQKIFSERLNYKEVPKEYYLNYVKGIKDLDLKGMPIEDFSPLQKCTGLLKLNCSETNLADLKQLGNLPRLRELDISKTKVIDLTGIENFPKLEKLDASENQEIVDITPLKSLSSLIELDLEDNEIQDISPLSNLVLLEELNLSLNDIEDISPLKNLSVLEELYLRKNGIESVQPISGLSNLVMLDIFNNKVANLSPIENLYKLTFLNISYNPVSTLSNIRKLNYLTELYISGIKHEDFNILSNFKYLSKLDASKTNLSSLSPIMNNDMTMLKIQYTDVSKGEVQRFKKKNPRCKLWYY